MIVPFRWNLQLLVKITLKLRENARPSHKVVPEHEIEDLLYPLCRIIKATELGT